MMGGRLSTFRRFHFVLPLFSLLQFSFAIERAETAGKAPVWDEDQTPAPAASPALNPPSENLPLYGPDPAGPAGAYVPLPFTSLKNAADFIQHQRGLNGKGLPALFWAPPGFVSSDSYANLLIHEGVGLYDTSLAILALIDAGQLNEAKEMLDIFIEGRYAPGSGTAMVLQALPGPANNFAFRPFDDDAYYEFDFTNVYGDWLRWGPQWKFWGVHTGPNAWLMNATLHYVLALKREGASARTQAPYIAFAETLGRAMQRLQDSKTQGGVRFAPQGVWHPDDSADPYFVINSENNLSAYAAFQLLAAVTGNARYAASAKRIWEWFTQSQVEDASGMMRTGMMDPTSGTFDLGVAFSDGKWRIQNGHPTDAGGSLAICAFGAAAIDGQWGRGASYRMWQSLRQRAGRDALFHASGSSGTLAGLDFADQFPISEALISPEWSGQGLFALQELLRYYGHGAGQGSLSADQLAGVRRDEQTMKHFIALQSNPYAIGPGHNGKRLGATGFGWAAPPPTVYAMAALYYTLAATDQADPLGDWRINK